MKKILYIDTNVWLDYFLNRKSKYISHADISLQIFTRAISCEFHIIISKVLLYELKKKVSTHEVNSFLRYLKPKLITIIENKSDHDNCKKYNIHFPDNLHIYLAKKHNATLISNDKELQEFGATPSQTL